MPAGQIEHQADVEGITEMCQQAVVDEVPDDHRRERARGHEKETGAGHQAQPRGRQQYCRRDDAGEARVHRERREDEPDRFAPASGICRGEKAASEERLLLLQEDDVDDGDRHRRRGGCAQPEARGRLHRLGSRGDRRAWRGCH